MLFVLAVCAFFWFSFRFGVGLWMVFPPKDGVVFVLCDSDKTTSVVVFVLYMSVSSQACFSFVYNASVSFIVSFRCLSLSRLHKIIIDHRQKQDFCTQNRDTIFYYWEIAQG